MKQFDGKVIKLMGTFEGTFETKMRFEIIQITVVACNKDYGLLGIDMLKVNKPKFINSEKQVNYSNETEQDIESVIMKRVIMKTW